MGSDAKLGFITGLAAVIVIAVAFTKRQPVPDAPTNSTSVRARPGASQVPGPPGSTPGPTGGGAETAIGKQPGERPNSVGIELVGNPRQGKMPSLEQPGRAAIGAR